MSYRERKIGYYQKNAAHDSFVCQNCGAMVTPEGAGTNHRNHCPHCLSSIHIDDKPGDRAANCGGIMEPVSVWARRDGEWAIIHRCTRCGHLGSNRIAADDSQEKLLELATGPLQHMAFPVDKKELKMRLGLDEEEEAE